MQVHIGVLSYFSQSAVLCVVNTSTILTKETHFIIFTTIIIIVIITVLLLLSLLLFCARNFFLLYMNHFFLAISESHLYVLVDVCVLNFYLYNVVR